MHERDGSLTGKTALITGAARRVGAEIARTLHAAGANLIIHYRKSARDAEALAAELGAARPNSATIIQADLLHIPSLPLLVEAAVGTFGGLDLLGTNLKVPLFLAQAAVPALRESRGLILNIVDIHALRPLRDYTVYCTAKA